MGYAIVVNPTGNGINRLTVDWFAPREDEESFYSKHLSIVGERFESEALRAEKMFDVLMRRGGQDLVGSMVTLGCACTQDLGVRHDMDTKALVFAHELTHSIDITSADQSKCAFAAHFTASLLAFAALPDGVGEAGHLDFENEQFDSLVQDLRKELHYLNH